MRASEADLGSSEPGAAGIGIKKNKTKVRQEKNSLGRQTSKSTISKNEDRGSQALP